ncbi:MAG TPA: o-succinylbenzoate synthase [Acidimicrobiales bacterium]|nr:o-succinylbenzoate synthase [Acidimicrobiales bacterium]
MRDSCRSPEVELRRLALPLRRPFRTAHGSVEVRELILVRVVVGGSEGWGECAALPEPGYSDEDVGSAWAALRDELVPALRAATGRPSPEAAVPAAARNRHPMAAAALEMALLDAELRAAGRSFAAYLGSTREWVEAGVALGRPGSVGELLDQVAEAVDEGYRRIKLKVHPGWDVEPVRAVRERFGDDLVLQVDANGAYGHGDAAHLSRLDPFALAMIEQPLPAPSLREHAELARRLKTPICLDESITSAAIAAEAVSSGAAAVINVKPGHMGGLREACRAHDQCVRLGAPAWVGGMLEAGLARAANTALASLDGFTLPGDLAPPDRYLAIDIAAPLERQGALVRVPQAPGIGATVVPSAVEAVTTEVVTA